MEIAGNAIKGKLLIAARKAMKMDLGQPFLDAHIASLAEPTQVFLGERLIASQWYSTTGIEELFELAAHELSMTPRDYARHLGHRVVDVSLSRITETFLTAFASPKRLASTVDTIWHQLYSSGALEAAYDAAENTVTIEQRSWKGHSELQCLNMMGSVEALAAKIRATRLLAVEQRISLHGDICRYHLKFS